MMNVALVQATCHSATQANHAVAVQAVVLQSVWPSNLPFKLTQPCCCALSYCDTKRVAEQPVLWHVRQM